jgi:hypothetical protein
LCWILTSHPILANDFTFARTLHGTPVALGTAGDCFSMSDCPQVSFCWKFVKIKGICLQGQFSIDLRTTGVRIVEDLQWKDQGHRTSSRIERKHVNFGENFLMGLNFLSFCNEEFLWSPKGYCDVL